MGTTTTRFCGTCWAGRCFSSIRKPIPRKPRTTLPVISHAPTTTLKTPPKWQGNGTVSARTAWASLERWIKSDISSFATTSTRRPGEALTPHTKGNRRVLYDFTFDAPKSVSLAYELGGDERIMDAFRGAVKDTMSEMESAMMARVRSDGRKRRPLHRQYGLGGIHPPHHAPGNAGRRRLPYPILNFTVMPSRLTVPGTRRRNASRPGNSPILSGQGLLSGGIP